MLVTGRPAIHKTHAVVKAGVAKHKLTFVSQRIGTPAEEADAPTYIVQAVTLLISAKLRQGGTRPRTFLGLRSGDRTLTKPESPCRRLHNRSSDLLEYVNFTYSRLKNLPNTSEPVEESTYEGISFTF